MTSALVTVRGEAHLEVSPDRANLSVTAHARGQSADRVRSALASSHAEIADVLGSHTGIVESSTSGLHVAPEFAQRRPMTITGYSGTVSTSVVVEDFDQLSPLVLDLSRLSGIQVDGPWWSLGADHPAHREARIAAIDDARSRAADYAAAFAAEVGNLVEISDLDPVFANGPHRMSRAMATTEMDEPAFDFAPTMQTVTGQVTVRFELDRPGR